MRTQSFFAAVLNILPVCWTKIKIGRRARMALSINPTSHAAHFKMCSITYIQEIYAKSSENIIELITAADEMDLEELSTECQSELIRIIKFYFPDESDGADDMEIIESLETFGESRIPIDVAIHTHIIPALNLASSHSLSHLSQKLFTIMLPRMSVIIKSPDRYTALINGISSEVLIKVIMSDNLAINERSVWDLALKWACHQTELPKTAVEARLRNLEDDDENDDEESTDRTIISAAQLNQLKTKLAPLLPAIRLSVLDPEDYIQMVNILSYFLSRRRFLELTRFFYDRDGTVLLDTPRIGQKLSMIITKPMAWEQLRENIFETGAISGCPTLNHLKFELLFRASEHGFLATTFHQRCDNKGPTVVLVRSADGHLFGGVNFNHWESEDKWSLSPSNFLFALPDGHHRKDWANFRIEDQSKAQNSSFNTPCYGPTFGFGCDLFISDSADANEFSYSNMPNTYYGSGASNTALAGAKNFMVSNYEVFSITYLNLFY